MRSGHCIGFMRRRTVRSKIAPQVCMHSRRLNRAGNACNVTISRRANLLCSARPTGHVSLFTPSKVQRKISPGHAKRLTCGGMPCSLSFCRKELFMDSGNARGFYRIGPQAKRVVGSRAAVNNVALRTPRGFYVHHRALFVASHIGGKAYICTVPVDRLGWVCACVV